MKKIYILFLVSLLTTSCSSNDEVVDAPESIENTSWYKYFDKEEVETAVGGTISTSIINSITLTYKITSDTEFEINSSASTTQGGINQTHTGTYTYNSNNGEVIFSYNNVSFFGRNSDKGVVNGDEMILENTFTFEKL